MSPVELLATLLGVLCVVLGVRRSVWTFPTAIGSVLLVGWAVWTARLYSDALLQLFFVGANLYGWANWRRSQADQGDVLVEAMSAGERARWTAGTGRGDARLGWRDGGLDRRGLPLVGCGHGGGQRRRATADGPA
jgi:nicotinamide mononucleotide transporter